MTQQQLRIFRKIQMYRKYQGKLAIYERDNLAWYYGKEPPNIIWVVMKDGTFHEANLEARVGPKLIRFTLKEKVIV